MRLNDKYNNIGGKVVSKSGNNPSDGKKGGLFVGRTHAEGGIKAVVKDTGKPIEVETSEVIITAPAVADPTKREFEGEKLTNKQILSKINQSGGGVAFADGGEVKQADCGCKHEKGGIVKGNYTFPDYNTPIEDNDGVHKMVVLAKEGNEERIVHFGAKGYSSNYSDEAREQYRLRHSKEANSSKLSAGWWAYQYLWSKNSPVYHEGRNSEHGERFEKHSDYIDKHFERKFKFEKGGQVYHNNDMVRIINKRVPTYEAFCANHKHIAMVMHKQAYKNMLKNDYNIDYNELPQPIKMGLLMGNQSLINKYING